MLTSPRREDKEMSKMGKEIITCGNTEIKKHKFQQHKSPILMHDINMDKIIVSNIVLFDKIAFKYFIGFEDDSGKMMYLCIMLPKMSAFRRDFEETKYMSFYIKANKLLEKYNETWGRANNIIEKGFDSKPVYNEKYLKTKIKSDGRKVNTIFHNDKMRIEGSHLFLKLVKTIILKCFSKDINTLSKKKK